MGNVDRMMKDHQTPPKVRVVGITDTPEILDLIGNVLSTVAIGDELLTVNGLSFDEWYEQNKFILGFGANDSGGQRGAFQYLAEFRGSSNILPEDDSITFQLRRLRGNQELYTVTVPYVALSNDECWSLSSSLYEELNSIAPLKYQPLQASNRSEIFWLISSRIPTRFCLIFVVILEDNSAADGIIQLFKPDATASQFRYLKNDVTKDLFYKGTSSKSPWSKAWRCDIRYQSLLWLWHHMEDSSIWNIIGHVYFNPVGVYTNGACYSAAHAGPILKGKAHWAKTLVTTFYTKIMLVSSTGSKCANPLGQLIEASRWSSKSDVIASHMMTFAGDRGVSVYDRIVTLLSQNSESGRQDTFDYRFIGTKAGKRFQDTQDNSIGCPPQMTESRSDGISTLASGLIEMVFDSSGYMDIDHSSGSLCPSR
ncbi:hypothetical protein BASA60_004993 [Batrachochytrium salamandrivorans]|nr:hypothetical protein BASA60_004993 [Batrachochytrium salamandrivorans]